MADGQSGYNRYLNGDKSGIEDIVREYNDSLILFINGYVHDLMTAEDLAADTIFKLIIKRKRFRDDASGSFKTWLFTIARNTALDWLRKSARRKFTPITDVTGYDEHDFDSDILKNEQKKALHKALSELNDDYREVLHLIYFEEMSYKQAAAVMKKQEKQIKNLTYRAKQSLAKILEKEDFVYEDV